MSHRDVRDGPADRYRYRAAILPDWAREPGPFPVELVRPTPAPVSYTNVVNSLTLSRYPLSDREMADRRGIRRRHEEVASGGGSEARGRKEVTGTGGKWQVEEEVPPRPWREEAWVMDSPLPPFWGIGMHVVKRGRSSALSRQLAASDAKFKMINQKCFDPLPGVTVTSTEWYRRLCNVSWYVWQVDNRSSAAVHFLRAARSLGEREKGRA